MENTIVLDNSNNTNLSSNNGNSNTHIRLVKQMKVWKLVKYFRLPFKQICYRREITDGKYFRGRTAQQRIEHPYLNLL